MRGGGGGGRIISVPFRESCAVKVFEVLLVLKLSCSVLLNGIN